MMLKKGMNKIMKTRLDTYLTEQGHAETRSKAQAMIMSGIIYVNNQKADKAGMDISEKDIIEVRGSKLKYVSRGGLKLEKAMSEFQISLEGNICGDFGASTGGFSDCMLQNGAIKVYAVDVGYGQLAWSLRTDERVINLERTNIRYLTQEQISDKLNFVSVDVSFISLKLILPVVYNFLTDDGSAVCLIKPQFEAGRDKIGKKGVVKDKAVHLEVVHRIMSIAKEEGFGLLGLSFSPIKGPEGNIEYLLYIKKSVEDTITEDIAETIVMSSHNQLDK